MNFKQRSSSVPRTAVPPSSATASQQIGLAGPKKLAVLVVHGMGQQIQFETMDAVAEGLTRYVALDKKGRVEEIRTATVRLGEEKLQRIEMDVPKPGQNSTVEVHIYEGYWAPVTQGKVTIRDVLAFFLRAGINGTRNAFAHFHRWIFGRTVSFGWRPWPAIWLVTALLFVLSLVAVNFIVTVLFADRVVGRMSGSGSGSAFSEDTFTALTTLVAVWVIATAVLGAVLYLVHLAKPRLASNVDDKKLNALRIAWDGILTVVGWLLWIPLALWIPATIALGLVLFGAVIGALNVDAYGREFFKEHSVEIWAALLIVSWFVRQLLVQYPGDVAAYIASHTLDAFDEIRSEIKTRIGKVAKAIYGSNEYHGVVWVGHSLGSVVAYDALNALITDDELAGRTQGVVERTNLLLTFGSPLDKTAFIFASQWGNTTETREAVSASFQPLILDYARFRRIRWVNIYSRCDVISGHLRFYDVPEDEAKPDERLPVANKKDLAASTPLLAHVEYWNNRLLFREIYEGLMHGEAMVTQPTQAARSAR